MRQKITGVALLVVSAVMMATTAEAKQGDYVAVPDAIYGGVYIVNTSDGSVQYCSHRSGSCFEMDK